MKLTRRNEMQNLVIISEKRKSEVLVLLSAAISAMNANNKENCEGYLNGIKQLLGLEEPLAKGQKNYHEFLVKFNPETYEQEVKAVGRPAGVEDIDNFRSDYSMIESANRLHLDECLKMETLKKLEVGYLYYWRNGGTVQYFIVERIEIAKVFVSRSDKDGLKSANESIIELYRYEGLIKAKKQPEVAEV